MHSAVQPVAVSKLSWHSCCEVVCCFHCGQQAILTTNVPKIEVPVSPAHIEHIGPANQLFGIIADAPCVRECTKELYPQQEDFDACYACGKSHPFQQPEYGSIEIVFEINYTRSSLLLGGVQSTLSTTCVSLLEEEGMKVQPFPSCTCLQLLLGRHDYVTSCPLPCAKLAWLTMSQLANDFVLQQLSTRML